MGQRKRGQERRQFWIGHTDYENVDGKVSHHYSWNKND